ncbi:50S rRNA methyltransferase [Leucothrix pacifica]|uniref:50S rRNA methyltransferase n=1 Tax=Leucothrix pacifica TaxID=1247513 RepID=A0A317CCF1_9GAMM|nr:50S rRNA methyltransferase [Leucothrix pacifica]
MLIKVPKTTALLEDQLIRLRPHLHKDSVIIAAGMIKHLQKSAFQCIEKIIGPLTTSLAKKKARLIFASLDEALEQPVSPYPTRYDETEIGLTLSNHANVFSREHLDLGARFFLTHFSEIPGVQRVVDLACGNGVLGIKYQQQAPDAQVEFIDESYMAVASTQDNYRSVFPDNDSASFSAVDGLSQTDSGSVDLILCNPPFHQQHVIGEQMALEMFRDSKRCLAQGGELWVVANRHLPYPAKLKQMFGNCRTVGTNKKFAVLRMVKR